jgi:hypothetical protein
MATMADAKRRLTIEHVSQGAEKAAGDLKKVASAHDGVAVASERSERAQQSMERRLETVQRKYDEVYRSQQALAQVDRTLMQAQQQGLITMQRRVDLLSLAAERHGLATSAINREIAATERLGDVQRMQVAANQNQGGFSRHNANNAAFQVQDIAMMSALGQSPFAVGMQQGPQLAMAMEAGGGLKALGAGLASLVSPTMLLTVGLTAATAAAIQFFMNMKSGSADSAEALEKQNELIGAVAARWGDALPGLKAYNDELVRQKDLSSALEASTAARSQQFIEERASVVDLTIDLDDLINKLQTIGANPTEIVELQAAFANLQAKVKDSTATAEDAYAVQKELNDLMGTGLPIVGEYANKFGELAGQIGKAAEAAEKFDLVQRGSSLFNRDGLESILGNLDPLNGFKRTPFQTEEDIMYAGSKPASTRVGATGTMTNVNGVNVHTYGGGGGGYELGSSPNIGRYSAQQVAGMSTGQWNSLFGGDTQDAVEEIREARECLERIDSGLGGYFTDLEETLKNDVTGGITKYIQQLIYAQTLASQTIAEAVNTSFLTGQSNGDSGSWAGRQFKVKVRSDFQQTVYDPRVHGSPQDFANLGISTGGLKINYAGMFAEGGDITVRGPTTGDRVPVMMHANGGETISVRKAGEGGGASKTIHLHYTPAPGDSDATSAQRMRAMVNEGLQQLARL